MDIELRTMIVLIEGEYPATERNTPGKMASLIDKEFGVEISEQGILGFYGISFDDYERSERREEYEIRY
tara:strand:+ start:4839 stop:5045 length:207 start_codon:yes stop_codon:yes gene_type:complete